MTQAEKLAKINATEAEFMAVLRAMREALARKTQEKRLP